MIRSVSITNWKGHEELHLSFRKGVNFIVGPNGIGKTSILDAICFALLGDIRATAIYRSLTFKDLIRDPDRDMEITLAFSPQGKDEYIVTRAQPAHGNKRGSLSMNGTAVMGRWDDVTAEILKLYDTNDLFLRRVVLLSEGDVFAYSTQPPGEGLTEHIENVLGINRMENVRENLRKLSREFGSEASGWKASFEEVSRSTDEDMERVQHLTNQLQAVRANRSQISETVDRLNELVGALSVDMRGMEDLVARAKAILEEWKEVFGNLPQNDEFLGAIDALKRSVGDERVRLLAQRDSLRDELAWLGAQAESQRQILEIIKPLEEGDKDVACPVCKRPLTAEMVKEIRGECLKILTEVEKRKGERQAQLPDIDRKIEEADTKLQRLPGIESAVQLVLGQEPQSLSVSVLESHLAELAEKRKAKQAEVEQLRGQILEKDEKIGSLERTLADLGKRVDEQERLEMMRSLTCATKGQFISQLFLESLESALAEQRRVLLEPLTEELATMWSSFLGIDVGVSLKDNAQITMVDKQSGNSLDFPQLSGGEKTALLIFTQILLCKYFSNADFMLLDEPLEHLDPRNRWALIKFLVDTTKLGFPRQLIVTTFEETLLREYLDDAEIEIKILSREHAMVEGLAT